MEKSAVFVQTSPCSGYLHLKSLSLEQRCSANVSLHKLTLNQAEQMQQSVKEQVNYLKLL